MIWQFHALMLPLVFLTGSFAGSFANVAIYRIPWQKSVVWPPSTCPRCLSAIAPSDNVPIFGWLRLRGKCRTCSLPIAARYPLIELLVALFFVAVYLVDVMATPDLAVANQLSIAMARWAFHSVLITLLVIGTFIDYDYYIIPDSVTVTGMLIGLAVGATLPEIRPEPATSATMLGGLWVGFLGLIVGGLIILVIRELGSRAFGREAMGLGDVTLAAMMGAFLGWQVMPLLPFLGALLGLGHAIFKGVGALRKWLLGQKLLGTDREIPFGPYLSLAGVILLLSWPWLWSGWAEGLYQDVVEVARFFWEGLGPGTPPPFDP